MNSNIMSAESAQISSFRFQKAIREKLYHVESAARFIYYAA